MRDPVEIAADIVCLTSEGVTLSADLQMEAQAAGIHVPALLEMAEELYELSEETFNETFDDSGDPLECLGRIARHP